MKEAFEGKRFVTANKTQKFSFSGFVSDLQQTNFKNVATWTPHIQYASWGGIAVLACITTWFGVVRPVAVDVSKAVSSRSGLLSQYEASKVKLTGLRHYETQLSKMEEQFRAQLNQLPKETEMSGLVEDISSSGRASGLILSSIKLPKEVSKQIFIEQPIAIKAKGNFHSFGKFIEYIAELPRIVTVQDFVITTEQKFNSPLKISYDITANTYRYLEMKIVPKKEARTPRKRRRARATDTKVGA